MHLHNSPNTTTIIEGTTYLYFSGTSYLGIGFLPDFQQIVFQSIQKWGTAYGSSRKANITLNIYNEGEQFLASFLKTEAAYTVSSGTLASRFALSALLPLVDAFYYMPKTHPSIVGKNAQPVFVAGQLNKALTTITNSSICICADAIAALETQPYSFQFLEEICTSNTVYILMDESHSLGVLGHLGSGVSTTLFANTPVKVLRVSSLGKAFGVPGGVIAGPQHFINLIKENPVCIGSAGMSPAFLEAFLIGQNLYATQQQKLQENTAFVYEHIGHLKKVSMHRNYPVLFFNDPGIANYLYEHNILITSFYYPASTQKINRIVLNANHSIPQLTSLVKNLIAFDKQ